MVVRPRLHAPTLAGLGKVFSMSTNPQMLWVYVFLVVASVQYV
jgi:hypothetical protein